MIKRFINFILASMLFAGLLIVRLLGKFHNGLR